MRRRELLREAGRVIAAGSAMVAALRLLPVAHPTPRTHLPPGLLARGLVRPPGALAEADLLAACIRCQRCVEACNAGAIQLFSAGTGALEGTPYLVPDRAACTLCLECGPACPTGALGVIDRMEDARMGHAEVDRALCVSHNGTGICGACFTACPLKGRAIRQGTHNQPTVDRQACVGCGACEESCIVTRDRAIRVHSGRSFA